MFYTQKSHIKKDNLLYECIILKILFRFIHTDGDRRVTYYEEDVYEDRKVYRLNL